MGSVENGHKSKFGLDLSWTVTEEERSARLKSLTQMLFSCVGFKTEIVRKPDLHGFVIQSSLLLFHGPMTF